MAKQRFTVILIPDTTGYQVVVPHYPECTTSGDTPEEAFSNAKEALELMLEVDDAERTPVPANVRASHVVVGDIELDLPEHMLSEVREYASEYDPPSKAAAR
ncbi:MAG: type II toxin-antitoxin system HicB family antitoxin [SAR202 cluster bacterium]|jgi:predicted RNase H-like HicB family nuclease|nr:type II toxin-antitoxin system HicB family antitoxin [SAR202 cluster bacterium]MDP6662508.1 type II toxin-antitoxin system HicB family antitoxin [SAR202 cluster bacterium]MDP6799724.1 type II toxin-antitoxin system HicB family antitoxin [SAR202 cluster bacterium]MQG57281.1 type II toxin-antitoxin system HicB family antitoxin [SAR202 cluster bacterium]|tara:strand:+ start:1776 stop:2081 length:306 start_codon:yes stop_codon:yes gene_type:complete